MSSERVTNNAVLEAFERVQTLLTSECRSESHRIHYAFGHTAAVSQMDGAKPRTLIWVPGDDAGNPTGTQAQIFRLEEPRQREDWPRALTDVTELVTVYCWSGDLSHTQLPQAERDTVQYADAVALWDAHQRALRLTCPGLWAHIQSAVYRRRDGAKWGLAIRSVYTILRSVLDVPFSGDPLVALVSGAGFDVTGQLPGETDNSHIRKDPL